MLHASILRCIEKKNSPEEHLYHVSNHFKKRIYNKNEMFETKMCSYHQKILLEFIEYIAECFKI